MDAVGQAYVDWVLTKEDLPALMNVVHPRPTSWDIILRGLRQELGDGLPIVPVQEWVGKLEELAKDPSPEDLMRVVSSCAFQRESFLTLFALLSLL